MYDDVLGAVLIGVQRGGGWANGAGLSGGPWVCVYNSVNICV